MKRQRTMYQMKEQDKTPEKLLNEVEVGNLPEKEFRMIVKIFKKHRGYLCCRLKHSVTIK